MCFPVNFAKFLKTPLFTEHLPWLLLYVAKPFFSKSVIQQSTILLKGASSKGVFMELEYIS